MASLIFEHRSPTVLVTEEIPKEGTLKQNQQFCQMILDGSAINPRLQFASTKL